MRLVVFGPGFPFRGGIARATTELVRALTNRRHEVLFLTPERQYPRWLYPGSSDRDPDACQSLDGARAVLDPFNPISWRKAGRWAEDFAADAWIMPYWTWAWSGLWRSLLRRSRRPPTVAVVHNPADHDAHFWQRLAAQRVLGSCQALFTHANVLASHLEHAYPEVPVGHHPLPPVGASVPHDRAAARIELDLPQDCRVALFLGLIRPYKGVDLLIDAAASLGPDSDWLIVVAGEPWGDLGERLRRQVANLGLGDRVRLDLGWVPESRIPVLMTAADVIVLPYRRGSQSAVAPMALACGLPVLSTAVGGVPEVVVDGRNGCIVPPGDSDAIAAALESLSSECLAKLADGARQSAAELSWSGYATALEELLAEIV